MANRKNSEDLRYNGLSVPKFEEGDSPKFWLEKFDKAGTLKKWSEEEKCIHFCFALGNHAEDWYTSLTEEVKNDFGSLKAKFLERFDNNVDRVYSYSVFLELSQGSDSVDSFIEKVLKCGRTLKKSEAEMMDKIIHGLNKEIKNFVIMKEAKSLEDVTKYARMGQSITKSENSQVCSVMSEKKNSDFHRQGNHSDRSQYYPQRRPFLADRGQRQDNFRDQRQRRPFQEMCEHCGKCNHISSACKFKNAKCFKCNQYGHIARVHSPYYKK